MINQKITISACVVVHNEEAIIERCLKSLKGNVDEIIIVHDGKCHDESLKIAKNYTDKIFEREKIGVMEPHLAFAYSLASSEFVLRIDPDEFIDQEGFDVIKKAIQTSSTNDDCFSLIWEMWDGEKVLHSTAFNKKCLFRRKNLHFNGITHATGDVDGKTINLNTYLRHRPKYNNVSLRILISKTNHQTDVHAKFFFPEITKIESFNYDKEKWNSYALKVRKYILLFIIIYPVYILLGQLKTGLWKNPLGIKLAVGQSYYYFLLGIKIWKMKRKLGLR